MTVLREGERLNLALVLTEIPQYVVFHKAGIEHAEKNKHEEAITISPRQLILTQSTLRHITGGATFIWQGKQYDEAISDYTKGIELSPASDGYHKRGRAYEGKSAMTLRSAIIPKLLRWNRNSLYHLLFTPIVDFSFIRQDPFDRDCWFLQCYQDWSAKRSCIWHARAHIYDETRAKESRDWLRNGLKALYGEGNGNRKEGWLWRWNQDF